MHDSGAQRRGVLLDKGIDPGAVRKAQKAADTQEQNTLEVLTREWHAKFPPTWAPNHADKIICQLELYTQEVHDCGCKLSMDGRGILAR